MGWGGLCRVEWVMHGWGGLCRSGVGQTGVGCVMKGQG